jgi:uncharacterized membrane protein YwaF
MLKITFFDWLLNNTDNYTRLYEPYQGLFSPLHVSLMIILVVWLLACPLLFNKFPNFSKKFALTATVIMLTLRVARMCMEFFLDGKSFAQIMPWHICHIMCFCIGIATIYNYFTGGKLKGRWLLASFCIFAFFGGLLTFSFGDYYQFKEISFYETESLYLHFVIPTLAVYHVSARNIWFTFANITCSLIFLLCLIGYGIFGNWWLLGTSPFGKEHEFFDPNVHPEVNVMFMRFNALPFNFYPKRSHNWTYITMILCAYAGGYSACTALWIRKKLKAV